MANKNLSEHARRNLGTKAKLRNEATTKGQPKRASSNASSCAPKKTTQNSQNASSVYQAMNTLSGGPEAEVAEPQAPAGVAGPVALVAVVGSPTGDESIAMVNSPDVGSQNKAEAESPGDSVAAGEPPAEAKRPAKAKPALKATPAKKPTKRGATPAKPGKLSALEAAAQVLRGAKQTMNCVELIAAMDHLELWSSPGGLTPSATLHAAISKEIATKGNASRFRKVGRGQFAGNTSGA
jgi:HB1, ASXL, restriction endonuclease HTH domain